MKKKNKRVLIGDVVDLSKLDIGNEAVIVQINIKSLVIKKRLLELGLTVGTIVKIKKQAPLGDPVVICVRDTELCLRKTELKNIIAKVVK